MSFNIYDIKREAGKHGLTLRKGKGYYYWDIDENKNERLGDKAIDENIWYGMYTHSISVYHWSHWSWELWMNELKDILDEYNKEKENRFIGESKSMIVDFTTWKYQEIFDYIKSFEYKVKCIKPVKGKIYENGFKTALFNSELYEFYQKFKKKMGLREYNIYYPPHTNKSFNIVHDIMKKYYMNTQIMEQLFKVSNMMIYELYFYEFRKDNELIKVVEEGVFDNINESDFNFSSEILVKNMNFECEEINNIREFLTKKPEIKIKN